MYVRPIDGRSVPDPDRGDLLPATGREVPETQYWLRRERDGDIQRGQPDAAPAAKGGKP